MNSTKEVFAKIVEKTLNINRDDIFHRPNKPLKRALGKYQLKDYYDSLKFKSKTRKSKTGRNIFLYITLPKSENYVRVLINRGGKPEKTMFDSSSIIYPQNVFEGCDFIPVIPEKIGDLYTYDDILELIRHSYELLDRIK